MTTLFSHEAFHEDVGHAFNELFLMDQLSKLPEASLMRILQSFPNSLLQQLLASSGEALKAGRSTPVI